MLCFYLVQFQLFREQQKTETQASAAMAETSAEAAALLAKAKDHAALIAKKVPKYEDSPYDQ